MTVIKPEFAAFFTNPPADVPPADVPPADAPPADVPPADVPPADVPPADVPPADVPPADVPPADVPPTDVPPADVPPTDVPPADAPPADEEYDEIKVLNFFKNKKGKDISSVDDLLKQPANKYENISDSVKSFLDYHTETGRGFEDFIALQKDISQIPDIEFAREKVRKITGDKNLSNEELDAYLERKLGVDLSDLVNIDPSDKIELRAFSKEERDARMLEQEKYKQPLENRQAAQEKQPIAEDEVELVTGERMKKADYDKLLKNRQDYLDGLKASSDNIKESSFSIKVDNKGSEQILKYGYEFSAEDKQNMLSMADDLSKTVREAYDSKEGFKHSELLEDLFFMNRKNREKAFSAMLHKALAERTESIMAEINNVKLGATTDLQTNKDGKKVIPVGPTDEFGVKFNFPQP